MIMNLFRILDHFPIKGTPATITPYGFGHINDTYLVRSEAPDDPDYILQRVNHKIFPDVPAMMQNISVVTGHLISKLQQLPGHDPFRETLSLVPAASGLPYHRDESGNFWRVFLFIPGMNAFEKVRDEGMAREAGRIIGLFHRLMADMQQPVQDTLPGFHSLRRRQEEYRTALAASDRNRRERAQDNIRFAERRFEIMMNYFNAMEDRGFPKRIVHYDTKINNILFDENLRAMCLIDMDTLCPGYVHFDYGDALRTLANEAAEDEKEPGRVKFSQTFYRSFTDGYLSESRAFLSEEEINMLPFAPIYMTFIIGLRFLTDYLNGDTYFKIKYPDHNLVRAKVQFTLVGEMERILL